MQGEKFVVDLVNREGEKIEAELILGEIDPQLSERVRLTLVFPGGRIVRNDGDYFAALCSIRRAIEDRGWLVRCYGASRNVWLPGASREANFGYYACKLLPSRVVGRKDWVRIFDSGPDVDPATVDEQEAYHKAWLVSLGWVFAPTGGIESKKLKYNPYNPPALVLFDRWLIDTFVALKKKAARWFADGVAAYRRRHAHR